MKPTYLLGRYDIEVAEQFNVALAVILEQLGLMLRSGTDTREAAQLLNLLECSGIVRQFILELAADTARDLIDDSKHAILAAL
jgi:hypothetical protein